MKKTLDALSNALLTIAGILFVVIFIIYVAGIICRTLLVPLLWVDDTSSLLFPWMLSLAMSVAVYRKAHLTIEFVRDKFPRNVQKVVKIVMTIVSLGFFGIITVAGWQTVRMKMGMNFTVLSTIPTGYAFAAMPVFGVLSLVFMTYRLVNIIQSKEEAPAEM